MLCVTILLRCQQMIFNAAADHTNSIRTRKNTVVSSIATSQLPALLEEDENSIVSLSKHLLVGHSSTLSDEDVLDPKYQTPVNKLSSNAMLDELEMRTSNNFNVLQLEGLSPMSKTGQEKTAISFAEAPNIRRKLIPTQGQSPVDALGNEFNINSLHYLPTGIIDYCIILGKQTHRSLSLQ